LIHDIVPGPRVITTNPELFWGLITSMWVGNLLLLVINLPLIAIWVWFLRVRYSTLFPLIVVFCAVGLFSIPYSTAHVYLAALFAVAGYFFRRARMDPAPLLLGFILGPMMEENLRRSLLIANGDPALFVSRPISAALLLCTVAVLVLIAMPRIRRSRENVF